ncbi:MAG: DUF3488 and transglutaminase-like domain-containing protein, partial [Vicinamibacteria bacterium]|nr:DUF3488 and transglutaminase-like domain-containing protein [Vicinamibacteria bacterium]
MSEPARAQASVFERLAAAICVGTALATCAFIHGEALLWLPAALAWPSAWLSFAWPTRLRALGRYAGLLLLAVAGLTGFVVALYPVVAEETTTPILRLTALGLAWLGVAALYDRVLETTERIALPAALGIVLVTAVLVPGDRPGLIMARYAPLPLSAFTLYCLLHQRALVSRPSPPRLIGKVLATLVFLGLAALILLGIVRLLPWAQPKIEQAMAEALSTSSSSAMTGFGNETRLGEIESLAQSSRLVMRVWSSEAQNLRLRVFSRFDGRGWKAASTAGENRLQAASAAAAETLGGVLSDVPGDIFTLASDPALSPGGPIRSRFVQSLFASNLLPCPHQAAVVRVADAGPNLDARGVLQTATGAVEIYGILNDPAAVEARARASDDDLELPAVIDPRMRALADELRRSAPDARGRVAETIAYLHTHCRYRLKVGRFRTSDPLAEFLFEKRAGYCEYFASAAAILLRLQGVPARYVSGFSVRAANHTGGHYVVRESDAHAWIEAYLEGQGWVEGDPTPPGDYAALHPPVGASWWQALTERVSASWSALMATWRQMGGLGFMRFYVTRWGLAAWTFARAHP